MSEQKHEQVSTHGGTADVVAAPDWFRSKTRPKSTPPPPPSQSAWLEIPEPSIASYCQPTVGGHLKTVARSEEAISCIFSLGFHLFLGLGIWILLLILQHYNLLPEKADFSAIEINAELNKNGVIDGLVDLETVTEVQVDMGSKSSPDESPELGMLELPPVTDFISSATVGSTSSVEKGNELGEGDKAPGLRFIQPKAGKVVTQGSFTAWTVPEDPDVGEDYQIIIQIQLPGDVKTYRVRDLSGSVMGTDSYRQSIPGSLWREELPIIDNSVQVAIPVPAAKRAFVRDTIKIKSRLLRERQTLQIEF